MKTGNIDALDRGSKNEIGVRDFHPSSFRLHPFIVVGTGGTNKLIGRHGLIAGYGCRI
jgi:hypothetical protein